MDCPRDNAGLPYTEIEFYNYVYSNGTNRAVLDRTSNLQNVSDHYPFGKRMPGRVMISDNEGNRHQFTGHEFDGETGYGYHGARYYNRELGRYMSTDPLADQFFGWTPYNYAMNSPIMLIDPTGMAPEDIGKYTVDEKGNVRLVSTVKSEQNYDMIYSESDWKNQNWSDGIRVDNQTMLKDLSGPGFLSKPGDPYGSDLIHATEAGSKGEKYKLFKFFADNTTVEWTVAEGQKGNSSAVILATANNSDHAVNPFILGINKGGGAALSNS